MKKIICFAVMSICLAACGGWKNTVSQQAAGYDMERNYLVAGRGDTPQAAAQDALDAMRRELIQNAPALETDPLLEELIALARVKKTWPDAYDPSSGFHALAVIPRRKVEQVLIPQMDWLDEQLAGITAPFAVQTNALDALKVARQAAPLAVRREMMDGTYQFLSAAHQPYQAERFAPYAQLVTAKMKEVLVGVDVQGPENTAVTRQVEQALQKVGVTPADRADPDNSITVDIVLEGSCQPEVAAAVECVGNASIHAVDVTRGTTFARFSVYERANASDAAQAMEQTMQAVGEQAASQFATRLESYLQAE